MIKHIYNLGKLITYCDFIIWEALPVKEIDIFRVALFCYSPADVDLPYVATEITTPSTPFAISLAKHLNAIGAKMYGAFWCSHCLEQKQVIFPL